MAFRNPFNMFRNFDMMLYPSVAIGDTFDHEDGSAFAVLTIDDCPYYACPPEWADYGKGGEWAYVIGDGWSEWLPVLAIEDALVTGEIEAAANAETFTAR